MSLEQNLKSVMQILQATAQDIGRDPQEITLVAVSKGEPIEKIQELYDLGVKDFAENRVNEALEKMEHLPTDIHWHFVGKLQKNKIPKVLSHFSLIHSVDTPELAEKISIGSLKIQMCTPILLQANTSGENTKGGLSPKQWEFYYPNLLPYEGIEIRGLMTMAPLNASVSVIRHCFSELKELAKRLQIIGGKLTTLSMGMSQDFTLAIQEGSTLVRIGSALFKGSYAH